MLFEIIGDIADVETIAAGRSVRDRRRLNRSYGAGWWRKRKGIATVQIIGGTRRLAEVHWYEADGVGRREFKVKRYLD